MAGSFLEPRARGLPGPAAASCAPAAHRSRVLPVGTSNTNVVHQGGERRGKGLDKGRAREALYLWRPLSGLGGSEMVGAPMPRQRLVGRVSDVQSWVENYQDEQVGCMFMFAEVCAVRDNKKPRFPGAGSCFRRLPAATS